MKKHRVLYGMLIVAAATSATIGVVWMMPSPQQEATLVPAPAVESRSGTIGANPFGKGETMAPVESPASHLGMRAGVFRVDGQGNLLLDADTKARLDMLTSTLSMNPTGHELKAIEASAVSGLPVQAAQQASRIVENYVRFIRAEVQLNARFAAEAAIVPEAMLNQIIALRRQHLGTAVADALFAEQEALDRAGMQLAMVEADPALTAQEKLARIDALQQALPKAAVGIVPNLEASRTALRMEHDVAALRQQGASETQIEQLRTRYVGEAAAKNIGEMELQKMDWERRQQAFSVQKNIIAQMSLSEQQKQARLEVVLSQIYSEEEMAAARVFHQMQPRR